MRQLRLAWDEVFMISIKKAKLTQKDVKNEGCSHDVIENKRQKMTHFDMANMYMKTNDVIKICQYVYENTRDSYINVAQKLA